MNNQRICIFGEVLFDHFPDSSCVLGGAPFNVAWHLQAFAQQPYFISRIGQDTEGTRIQTAMQHWGMDLSGLQIDPEHPTGTVQVSITNGEPSYTIVPAQAYDFIDNKKLPDTAASLLYHGTLALRHAVSQHALNTLKAQHSGKLFVDVNLRQPWWDKPAVLALLADADWVKLNQQELQALQSETLELKSAMQQFLATYKLTGLVVTCGEQGALAITAAGEAVSVVPTQAVTVVDTIGAGDAFAAVLLLGIHLGWSLQTTLDRAQSFASALVGQRGATVQAIDFYQPFIQSWDL